MDPLDAPARLSETLEEEASTPIARVAGEDTLPLYSLYGTSSIFVRVDDTQEESGKGHSQSGESGEQSGEQTGEHVEDQRDHAVMIVPVADLVRPRMIITAGECLPVCATVGFFVLLAAATGLYTILENTPGANITPV